MFRIICKAFDVGDIAISWLICKLHLQHIPILISIQICKLRSGKSASHRLLIAVKNAIASFSWLTCKLGMAMSADNSPPAPAEDGSAGLSDFLTGMLFILLLAAYFMVFIIMMVFGTCLVTAAAPVAFVVDMIASQHDHTKSCCRPTTVFHHKKPCRRRTILCCGHRVHVLPSGGGHRSSLLLSCRAFIVRRKVRVLSRPLQHSGT